MPPWIFSVGKTLSSMARCKNVVVILSIALFGIILLVSAWNRTGRSSFSLESRYLLEESADICELLNYCSDKELLVKAAHCPSVRIKHALSNISNSHSTNNGPSYLSLSNTTVLESVFSQVEYNTNDKKTPHAQHYDASLTHVSVLHNSSTPVLIVNSLKPTPDTGSEYSHKHPLPVKEGILYDKSGKEEEVAYLLAVMVISSPNAKDRRQAIRETWKRGYEAVDSSVAIKFVIGTLDLLESEMASLHSEHTMYKDLVLLHNLKDDYRNLTRKVLYTLVWASEQLHFSYLLKCDDDTYVRVNALLSELRRRRSTESLYWGYFTGRNRPLSKGKWAEHN